VTGRQAGSVRRSFPLCYLVVCPDGHGTAQPAIAFSTQVGHSVAVNQEGRLHRMHDADGTPLDWFTAH
jgi:hypothetical protein